MTKRDFFKENENDAFNLALTICAGTQKYEGSCTTSVATEMNLILNEWYDDYCNERV